ncbi:MAG: hypothetical protein GXP45_05760, partial [bacterium]|nr:hypothetical protein [bacterium]
MKTKNLILTIILALFLGLSNRASAQNNSDIIGVSETQTDSLLNTMLQKTELEQKQKEKIKKDSLQKIKEEIIDFNQKLEAKYRKKRDSLFFLKSRDLLKTQITELDKEISDLQDSINGKKSWLRTSLKQQLDSLISDHKVVSQYMNIIETTIKKIETSDINVSLIQENYPNYDLFSDQFDGDNKNQLVYLQGEKMKRKKEMGGLQKKLSLLQKRVKKSQSELIKLQQKIGKTQPKINKIEEDIQKANQRQKDIQSCLMSINALEQELFEKGSLDELSNNKTRSKMQGILNRYKMPYKDIIKTYG